MLVDHSSIEYNSLGKYTWTKASRFKRDYFLPRCHSWCNLRMRKQRGASIVSSKLKYLPSTLFNFCCYFFWKRIHCNLHASNCQHHPSWTQFYSQGNPTTLVKLMNHNNSHINGLELHDLWWLNLYSVVKLTAKIIRHVHIN